ncbi:hypothetical protein JHK85_025412 [Glycine max]|nr:hypothetical protein JHK85_025412 [Glycine max]
MCYRLKHKFAEKKVARGVGSGCKLRNKASWVKSTFSEEPPSLYASHSSVTSSTLGEEDSCPSPLPPDLMPSIDEKKMDQITREDYPMKVGIELQSNPTPSELFLDKSVSCIPRLSKRHYQQLDNCGFHTVVVGCQVAESESALEHVTSDAIDMQEKTVYLHLKKFFRGSRFTFKAFLKSLAEKYQEGDIVCVSGKAVDV